MGLHSGSTFYDRHGLGVDLPWPVSSVKMGLSLHKVVVGIKGDAGAEKCLVTLAQSRHPVKGAVNDD